MESFFSVLIVSAGQGKRFGKKKQFSELGGIPLFFHSYLAFQNFSAVKEIIFVTNPEDRETYEGWFSRLGKTFPLKLKYFFTNGGSERYLSVRNGLRKCNRDYPLVMIHDAARPLIRQSDLGKIIAALSEENSSEACNEGDWGCKGVVPFSPVTDTIKVIDENNQVTQNLERDTLAAVSTPQGFLLSELISVNESLEKNGGENGIIPTDDVEVFMKAGHSVTAVKLAHPNPKITYQHDLSFAEEIYVRDKINSERLPKK